MRHRPTPLPVTAAADPGKLIILSTEPRAKCHRQFLTDNKILKLRIIVLFSVICRFWEIIRCFGFYFILELTKLSLIRDQPSFLASSFTTSHFIVTGDLWAY